MKVSELIAQLQALPKDYEVFRENGDYKDDWREVNQVYIFHKSTRRISKGVYLD